MKKNQMENLGLSEWFLTEASGYPGLFVGRVVWFLNTGTFTRLSRKKGSVRRKFPGNSGSR